MDRVDRSRPSRIWKNPLTSRSKSQTWITSERGIFLPNSERPRQRDLTMKKRREKQFGEGRSIPLDRNAKARVLILAQSFLHRMPDGSGKPKGKAYGALTAKHLDVLRALLLGFHNCKNGRCFPSYDSIADRAGCARSTVDLAI